MVEGPHESPPSTLVVAPRLAMAERLTGLMRQLTHRVEVAFELEQAGTVARSRRFDVVVVAFENPPDEISWLAAAVRRNGSASRGAALIVCCDAFAAQQTNQVLWPGVNRIVLLSESDEALLPAVERLLDVAPRVRAALPSRIEVAGPGFARRFFCQTVNVSSSGMLLRVPHSLRPGTQLRFELFVSSAVPPVRGQARVVRLARPDREPFPAVGVAFSHLEVEDQVRLQTHLQRLAA